MRHLFNYRTSSFGRFFKNLFKVLTARYSKVILAKATGTSLIKLLKKRRLLNGNSRETFLVFFSRSLIEFLKLEAIEYISEISTQDLNYFLKLCAFYCLLSPLWIICTHAPDWSGSPGAQFSYVNGFLSTQWRLESDDSLSIPSQILILPGWPIEVWIKLKIISFSSLLWIDIRWAEWITQNLSAWLNTLVSFTTL